MIRDSWWGVAVMVEEIKQPASLLRIIFRIWQRFPELNTAENQFDLFHWLQPSTGSVEGGGVVVPLNKVKLPLWSVAIYLIKSNLNPIVATGETTHIPDMYLHLTIWVACHFWSYIEWMSLFCSHFICVSLRQRGLYNSVKWKTLKKTEYNFGLKSNFGVILLEKSLGCALFSALTVIASVEIFGHFGGDEYLQALLCTC